MLNTKALEMYKFALLFLAAISISNVFAETDTKVLNIIVSDFYYHYSGGKTGSIDTLREDALKNTDSTFLVTACHCADSETVLKVMDVLQEIGAKNIAVESQGEELEVCLECN